MSQIALLSEAEIEDRFHVTGSHAVSFLLAGFAKSGEQFSVNFGGERFLTMLLAVQPDRGGLIFDCSGSADVNRRLLLSNHNVFVGRPENIHVQFATGAAWEVMHGGSKAFAVSLPKFVVRMQRREYFRIETPRVDPLEFFGRLPEGGLLKLAVHDISLAGMAILASDPPPALEVGQVLDNCHCALPGDKHVFFFSSTVRHLTSREGRNGAKTWRIGLEFNGLKSADEMRIQRYIARVEHERHELR